jgi:hypothetical protein
VNATVVAVTAILPPLASFLEPGAAKLTNLEEPFSSFTRPIHRASPPLNPAGLDTCSSKAEARWKGDGFRLQPYQYEDGNRVADGHGPRRLKVIEQARMLGYNSNHFGNVRLSEDERRHFVGNSFPVVTAARHLAGLVAKEFEAKEFDITEIVWETWTAFEERAKTENHFTWQERFGPSSCGPSLIPTLRSRVLGGRTGLMRGVADPARRLTDEEFLVFAYSRVADAKGTDLRLDTCMPFAPHQVARASIDPGSWRWKVILSYAWKQSGQHINVLETAAVLDLLRKLARDEKSQGHRRLILVDNQAALGVLAKGRSTSKALMGRLMRCSALLMAGGLRLVLGWVRTDWNPADGPSRWVTKRLQK